MEKPVLILIAGGTASGKTTVVEQITKKLPKDVSVICMDNYYKQRDDLPFEKRKKINYDHPDALDLDLLKHPRRRCRLLRRGLSRRIPGTAPAASPVPAG